MPASPWQVTPRGVRLHLRVTPNAGADRIEGVEQRDDGNAVLRLRVAAVADRGKANAAMVALLAKALGVPRSDVTLVAGETARHKTIEILGDGPALLARLASLA